MFVSFLLCNATHSAAFLRQVICLSVCFSVTLRYRDHMGWNSLDIISHLISLWCLLCADPNITDLLQKEHKKFDQNRGRVWKRMVFGVLKL